MRPSQSSTDADHSHPERVFYVDLSGALSPSGLQDSLAAQLPLPEYYGGNLDALYDALCECGAGWNVILYNCAEPEEAQTRYFGALRRLCRDACEETPGLRIRFFG